MGGNYYTPSTNSPSPIVCALDGTGSMGNWADVIYEKFPMFYGQIIMQGYLQKPPISFDIIGDANTDEAVLQATDFAEGDTLDAKIESLHIEHGGGGQVKESYELAAYFYARKCTLTGAIKPFFFFTGDEAPYDLVSAGQVRDIIGDSLEEGISSQGIFQELARKFDTLLIHKSCVGNYSQSDEEGVMKKWISLLGKERILMLEDPKAIVDIMLGAITLTVGHDDLNSYSRTMSQRGQTKQRINEVQAALAALKLLEKFNK